VDIEILRLTPEMIDNYLYFFENVAHEDCYCTCFCSDDQDKPDFSARNDGTTKAERVQMRRNDAIRYIKDGKIQGYLAYMDGQVVGWCNANDRAKCTKCGGWKFGLSAVNTVEPDPNAKIKSVFCFVIAPELRRTGIALRLLERVCLDALKDGYACVEAYPNKQFQNIFFDHMGPLEMYEKMGFVAYGEAGEKIVMRKI